MMPRVYKPKPNGRRYQKYDENIMLEEAVHEYKTTKVPLKVISEKYKISISVLHRHSSRNMKKRGGQTVLSAHTEENIIQYINICAESGYPVDPLNLRFLIKCYLDKLGKAVLKFRNNLPGPDFLRNFLNRHKDKISPIILVLNFRNECYKSKQ